MRPTSRPFWLLLALTVLLLTGCDSNDARSTGSFQAEVRSALTLQLDGSAELLLQYAGDGGAPVSFEVVLTAQRSEITFESASGSGGPEAVTYPIERAAPDTASQVVYATFDPDRLSATSERFDAHSGALTITRATENLVEGTFEFDATGTNNPNAEVLINGQFTVQR